MLIRSVGLLTCFLLLAFSTYAQSDSRHPLEAIINNSLQSYDLTQDNQFKLAAYAELKGRLDSREHALILNFGSLGHLTFFQRNLLFRNQGAGVYSLNRFESDSKDDASLNKQLRDLFERIILMGNQSASAEHIAFVDACLARKNLEPFEKIYMRHILLKYGRYDAAARKVTFHTDWLPERTFAYLSPSNKKTIRQPINPMSIKLDSNTLRGYYLRSGGTVYVENVDREVLFATGEEYDYNVAAFKLFAQKLFVQTVQYIAKEESKRLESLKSREGKIMNQMVTADSPIENADRWHESRPRRKAPRTTAKVAPLYHQYSWIPMMLTILRANKINIGDEDVIKYFVNESYFPKIYEQLTREERSKVDVYMASL